MEAVISTAGLTVGFGKKEIVRDATIDIKRGAITTIVGVNGSGKSTLIKTISRMIPSLGGEVLFLGEKLSHFDDRTIAKCMAYLAQRHYAPEDVTVEELVYYGRYPHKKWFQTRTQKDKEIVDDALAKTGLLEFRERRIASLSGGESQRAWIAMCLAQEPEIMILDEPTTFMDVYHQLEVLELLRKLNREHGITIVMVLHDLNQAMQYSDEIIVVHNGKIHSQGDPSQILTTQVLYDVFRIRAKCVQDDEFGTTFIPYPERKSS